jgi:hypothetical protein
MYWLNLAFKTEPSLKWSPRATCEVCWVSWLQPLLLSIEVPKHGYNRFHLAEAHTCPSNQLRKTTRTTPSASAGSA